MVDMMLLMLECPRFKGQKNSIRFSFFFLFLALVKNDSPLLYR